MAECEICGAEIRGKAHYVSIGTTKLRVCDACARYGTVVVEEEGKKAKIWHSRETKAKIYEQMDHEIEEEQGFDVDYGRKVRVAREKAGLKQDELAKKIKEKQSVLRKIENDEMIPSEEVTRKIKRALKPFI